MYRIMIVEDDEVIARAVQQSLFSWGMDAFCVQDFSGVLAEFAVKNPQLVLMDIHLPFFNGFHWCAYSARTAHPFQRNGAPFRFKLSKAQQVD